jgi:hypothetical protein
LSVGTYDVSPVIYRWELDAQLTNSSPVGTAEIRRIDYHATLLHQWISEAFSTLRNFSWQEGYGAFSISVSGIDDTVAYIKAQDEHHRRRTFKEEFLALLKKHRIAYDERYVWG